MHDPIERPSHYCVHPSGVECIQITEHMDFCLGNAIKYIWRAGLKGDKIEDLKKAKWYIDREIKRREKCDGEVKRTESMGAVYFDGYRNCSTAGSYTSTEQDRAGCGSSG